MGSTASQQGCGHDRHVWADAPAWQATITRFLSPAKGRGFTPGSEPPLLFRSPFPSACHQGHMLSATSARRIVMQPAVCMRTYIMMMVVKCFAPASGL